MCLVLAPLPPLHITCPRLGHRRRHNNSPFNRITLIEHFRLWFFHYFLRWELCRHHEQRTAASMHYRCRQMALVMLLVYFIYLLRGSRSLHDL